MRLTIALLLGAGCCAAVTNAAAASDAATGVSLVVPAYFDATANVAYWDSLTQAALKAPTTAILNPDSGPGTSEDPAFVAAVSQLRAAGGHVLGYVSTAYAKRPLSDIVADINRYVSFYAVDGFFIDEMTSDDQLSDIQFYQSIYNYVKGLKASYSVVANPGTNIPELYASLPTADRFVVFEDDATSYAAYRPMQWQASYSTNRFVHIVYNVGAAQMPGVVKSAKLHGAGGIFVTSLSGPNPYSALPSYWQSEVRVVSKH
ncbi:spherulation-specific family 4 protein [Burkholderia sp. 8Y]|uniref:spherulation-specific family 4 protein n=1 Tax=Burkholderia sp. 8Y TaxID=2653133 RepID=UPI001F3B4C33|nr:spherulation-specific family 4 protein [Burkholderia sp. 8Y]